MRLAFIANGLSYGGAEKMLVFVATELSQRGHDVAIFNTREHEGASQKLPQALTVYHADINTKNHYIAYFRRLAFCIKSARRFKPEVVIGFLTFPNLYSVITGRILGIPSIISERADPFLANKHNSILENLLLKAICSASGAVFQTEGASLFYPKALRERSEVIPNPIAITKEYSSIDYANRDKVVVSLGRLDNHQKRIDVLLAAFNMFHKTHPDYVLHIYGSGPDKQYIQSLIDDNKMSEFAILKGVSNNPFEDLAKGKIFAITSDYEGISNSLLEAMAVGMPVVATDHSPGGARFLINDGENGLITPVGDIEAFAKALGRFADDEEFAIKCGQRASEVLTMYSPAEVVDRWEQYLIKLAANED